MGTRGEANIALVWRGTEGTKKSKVEAGRLKTGKKDGTWLKERSRRTGRANERQRPRLDLSDCLWLAAGCTDHTPLSAHQRPISFVSAGVARVSYRCVYNLPHGFLIRLPDSANRGDKRASAAFASRVYLCKRKRYSDLRRMNHNDGTAVQWEFQSSQGENVRFASVDLIVGLGSERPRMQRFPIHRQTTGIVSWIRIYGVCIRHGWASNAPRWGNSTVAATEPDRERKREGARFRVYAPAPHTTSLPKPLAFNLRGIAS